MSESSDVNGSTEAQSSAREGSIIGQTTDGQILYLKSSDDAKQVPTLRHSNVKDASLAGYQSTLSQQVKQDTKIYVIVSVLSGAELAESFAEKVLLPVLDKLGISKDEYKVVHTEDANTITKFARNELLKNANEGARQLIILLSGDGGIIDILNALQPHNDKYREPEISLIPMGTGNALANSSGLTDPTWGLAALARGHAKPLPNFRVRLSPGARLLVNEGRTEEALPTDTNDGTTYLYGAVVCSWGMHAGLVADSDTAEYRKFGVERFKMAANEALYPADGSPPHRYRAKVSVQLHGSSAWQEVPRTEHAYVLVTPLSSLEKGFVISPAAEPLSGALRIVHFGPMGGDEMMDLMKKAYDGGKHVDEPSVAYEQVDRVRIAFEGLEFDGRWRRICVDGKIIRVESDGWLEIERLDESLVTLRQLR